MSTKASLSTAGERSKVTSTAAKGLSANRLDEATSAIPASALHCNFVDTADRRMSLLMQCMDRIEDVVFLIEATSESDKSHCITYANRACEERTGYASAQLIASIPPAFIDAIELVRALDQTVCLPCEQGTVTVQCRPIQGDAFYVDVELLQPSSDYVNRSAWVATGRDRRVVERELKEREEQLAEVVETAMDAIITVDHSRRIQVFNRAASAMFGISAADARGEFIERFVPNRVRDAHAAHVSKFAESGTTVRKMGGLLHVLTGLRANGEEFPIEASISKMERAGSSLMTAVIRDVSELRRAEESRRAQVLAEGSNRAKTTFLSRMSHELRTPLNAVLGFAQVLTSNDREPPSPWQKSQLQQICSGGWHLLALIDDVLDVTQIEAGKLQLKSESVTLTEILDSAISMLRAKAENHRVTLHASYASGGACIVRGDPIRIRQVVLNVLSNAIKYNVAGGKVVVAASHRSDKVSLTVFDTGIGMSTNQLEHLFEPFNRLGRDSTSIEGTGIGLFLSRQLVELMGGEMSITSVLGGGTRVVVVIPAADAPAQHDVIAVQESPLELVQGPIVGTVLYVEDNEVNYLLVEQMLQRWPGVTLARAHTACEAVDLVKALEPDVTLLDMRLPDGTGLDVLHALRSSKRTRYHKVIALSASAMPDEVTSALRAGANDYWTKPLDYDAFIYDMAVLLRQATPA